MIRNYAVRSAIAAVILGTAAVCAHAPPARETLAWSPHPIYGGQFPTCPALMVAGVDNGLLNGLVRARSPVTRGGDMVNGFLNAAAPGHGFESEAYDERIHYLPLAAMICRAAANGRTITFGHGYFSGRPDSMVVSGRRGAVPVAFEDVGTGLDGERLIAIKSFGARNEIDDLHGDAVPTCLGTTRFDAEMSTALVDTFGGIIGAVMGQGGEENQAVRDSCRMVADKVG